MNNNKTTTKVATPDNVAVVRYGEDTVTQDDWVLTCLNNEPNGQGRFSLGKLYANPVLHFTATLDDAITVLQRFADHNELNEKCSNWAISYDWQGKKLDGVLAKVNEAAIKLVQGDEHKAKLILIDILSGSNLAN